MDIKEIWEADRQRTERVRAIQAGPVLDARLAYTLNNGMMWEGASDMRHVAVSALAYVEHAHPDRVEAFAQRLLDEVAPWATSFQSAIELCTPEMPTGKGMEGGAYTVLRILTAEPASIVRAIILALPERET